MLDSALFRVRLFDLSCFQIEAFVTGVAHGEGLAGQGAVFLDGGEQVALFHTLEDESAGGIIGTAQIMHHLFAVNVVDAGGKVGQKVVVQKRL